MLGGDGEGWGTISEVHISCLTGLEWTTDVEVKTKHVKGQGTKRKQHKNNELSFFKSGRDHSERRGDNGRAGRQTGGGVKAKGNLLWACNWRRHDAVRKWANSLF